MYTELDQTGQNIVPVAWVFCYPLPHTKRTSILKVVQEFHVRQFSFVKSQPEKKTVIQIISRRNLRSFEFPSYNASPPPLAIAYLATFSLSWREAGLEGETKEEKRKATFSFLYFDFPSSPARAPCSSPTPRTKVHAPRSSLASP